MPPDTLTRRQPMATHTPPEGQGGQAGKGDAASAKDVELLRVGVVREGKQVSAQWALHPQLKHDLQPDELKELSDLMGKVAGIVGNRFTELLANAEPDQPGNA